jgi:hypothetical protein
MQTIFFSAVDAPCSQCTAVPAHLVGVSPPDDFRILCKGCIRLMNQEHQGTVGPFDHIVEIQCRMVDGIPVLESNLLFRGTVEFARWMIRA